MRVFLLSFALVGCGGLRLGEDVRLGDELPTATAARSPADAQAVRSGSDAGATKAALDTVPVAFVSVTWPEACGDCVDLLVVGTGGQPPYRYEWEDGVETASRHLCGDEATQPIPVVVEDAQGVRSAKRTPKLERPDASCTDDVPSEASHMCLQNPSFEGKPGVNTGFPSVFEAAPWSLCSNPVSLANTPEIGDPSLGQSIVTDLPVATEGKTWLGLMEGEQASQRLCSPALPGAPLSFTIDLRRLSVGGNIAEGSFLEIWGGSAADCSAHELLWTSPKLSTEWTTFCATLIPTELTDNIVLRSASDQTQAMTATYMFADNIVQVDRCP